MVIVLAFFVTFSIRPFYWLESAVLFDIMVLFGNNGNCGNGDKCGNCSSCENSGSCDSLILCTYVSFFLLYQGRAERGLLTN